MHRWPCVLIVVLGALGCAAEDALPSSQPSAQGAAGQLGIGGAGGAGTGSLAGQGAAGAAGMTPAVTAGSGGAAPIGGAGGGAAGGGAGSAGASGVGGGAGGAGMPQPSSGCGVPWTASDAQLEQGRRGQPMQVARRETTVNGVQRLHLLAVPPDYDAAKPYPLVFGFHGFGGDREQLRGYMNVEVPAAGQAIFVYPEGLLLPDRGDTGWNTSGESDDLAFVDALLAQYVSELCIDQARIFATGHSFGGCMSNTVGCFRGDVFRAIAPVAGCGPFARRGGTACVGQVAALLIHSPNDTTTEYGSGIAGCTTWLRANGCDEMPACGCHWVEALQAPEDACMQEAQQPYEPGVPVEVTAEDDAPPAFRSYLNCDPGYPVVFADHYNRENRTGQEERWHNPPPWAPSVIWHFLSTLPPVEAP